MTTGTTTLLLIDVQHDFHPPHGSLAVTGADADADRIAAFLARHADRLDRVVATMDSHHELHVAHSGFWVDAEGRHPAPFTPVSSSDVESGRWTPDPNLRVPSAEVDPAVFGPDVFDSDGNVDVKKYCVEYTKLLEAKGRFQLFIWPEHCIIGTEGHNIVPNVRKSMADWTRATGNIIEWVHKGQNVLTEMYSALAAEVPVTDANSLNQSLLHSLVASDRVIVAGQALSHCVNFTVRDMVAQWPKDQTHKICILTDCTSSVTGFEEAGETFLQDMKEAGVTVCTSENVFDVTN